MYITVNLFLLQKTLVMIFFFWEHFQAFFVVVFESELDFWFCWNLATLPSNFSKLVFTAQYLKKKKKLHIFLFYFIFLSQFRCTDKKLSKAFWQVSCNTKKQTKNPTTTKENPQTHTTSVVHVCINLGHNISSMDVYSPYLSLENTKKNHKNKHVGDIE